MLTAKFFDVVEYSRLMTGRNMWSDMLEIDLVYIICGWED